MSNLALRDAMFRAKMDEVDLAQACGVDPKTVTRWLADAARVPYPKHRHAAALALGEGADVLWPEAVREVVKTGADREIVSVYPYRSLCPASLWRGLITAADSELWFAGYTNYFLWLDHPNLRTVLRRKAQHGCRVRFLLGDPDSEVTRQREQVEDVALSVTTRIKISLEHLAKLRDVVGIETRYSDEHLALSVFRFDGDAIVTPHLGRLVGHDSPTFHLRRKQADGVFDRFTTHVTELWERARPTQL